MKIIYGYQLEDNKVILHKYGMFKNDSDWYYQKDYYDTEICRIDWIDTNQVNTVYYESGCVTGIWFSEEQNFSLVVGMFVQDIANKMVAEEKLFKTTMVNMKTKMQDIIRKNFE